MINMPQAKNFVAKVRSSEISPFDHLSKFFKQQETIDFDADKESNMLFFSQQLGEDYVTRFYLQPQKASVDTTIVLQKDYEYPSEDEVRNMVSYLKDSFGSNLCLFDREGKTLKVECQKKTRFMISPMQTDDLDNALTQLNTDFVQESLDKVESFL